MNDYILRQIPDGMVFVRKKKGTQLDGKYCNIKLEKFNFWNTENFPSLIILTRMTNLCDKRSNIFVNRNSTTRGLARSNCEIRPRNHSRLQPVRVYGECEARENVTGSFWSPLCSSAARSGIWVLFDSLFAGDDETPLRKYVPFVPRSTDVHRCFW